MSDYVDMVLAKREAIDRGHLYVAPAFSRFKRGDDVMVETSDGGKRQATIIDSLTVEKDSDKYKFIRHMTGMRSLKKVIGKVVYLTYEEEKNGTDHDGE
jgi:hypothetical protein